MSKIKGKNTSPEIQLRKALWHRGMRFRVDFKVRGVRPDIIFTSQKIVIFVDGCFWHGCPLHYVRPRSRTEFWAQKLSSNTSRDRRQTEDLIQHGWRVLRFWEHEVNTNIALVVEDVVKAYSDTERLFRNRKIVVRVEASEADETVEKWYFEYLIPDGFGCMELRYRRPKKSNST